ncbi:hypothetical protein BJ138DRAFT_894666 [Hygrophoropsis aurantiaca]|uniref:Uncharacterized protein n=1 Tax=Hygrophoropsis aurantiaca TaxID=72124 RepID=A0ACB7ZV91_9AGAM|nr:hypothetical protein BJ138DRAFT_894666 [Hygrophoropsis aurantiaca]
MFQTLPLELICKIINHLPIESILRLRRVSKHLNQVTYDRSIWDHAYRTCALVLPPGPFTWQTAHTLESNLVQSARLSLNWPPNPDAKPVRVRSMNLPHFESKFALICGRWLVAIRRNEASQIVCYDMDKAEEPTAEEEESYTILYECPEKDAMIEQLFAATFLSEIRDDAIGIVVIMVSNAASSLLWRTLYRVIADGTSPSPQLSMVLRTNATSTSRSLVATGPKLVALYYEAQTELRDVSLIDIESYQQYQLPERDSNPDEDNDYTLIISSTHVITIGEYGYQGTLIQAYKIPQPQVSRSSTAITLQLSHEGMVPTEFSFGAKLLRDSKVDQLTQITRIVAVNTIHPDRSAGAETIILHPAPRGLGSITVDLPSPYLLAGASGFEIVQPSFNGMTRGIRCYHMAGFMHCTAFVLDDEDDENSQRAVVHDMKCFRELRLVYGSRRAAVFDAFRGRIITTCRNRQTLTVVDFV